MGALHRRAGGPVGLEHALGVLGAIFAIPMTSILIIVTSNFDATCFIAVLLSERGKTSAPEPAREEPG